MEKDKFAKIDRERNLNDNNCFSFSRKRRFFFEENAKHLSNIYY